MYLLFSPLGKLAGRAIYFTFHSFFLFLIWAKLGLSLDLLDRFSRFLHQMEGISVNVVKPVQFFRFLKGRCHGNQFCVVPDLFARSRSISGSAGPIFTIFAFPSIQVMFVSECYRWNVTVTYCRKLLLSLKVKATLEKPVTSLNLRQCRLKSKPKTLVWRSNACPKFKVI